VNPEQAAAILGVRLPCGKKDARSAYLRLLKVHKPDRDPEGFRRVREAWERLEGLGDPIGAWLSPRPAAPVQAAPAAPVEAAPVEAIQPAPPEPPGDPLDAFYERLEAAGYESPDARVEIAREAVLALPDLAAAHWLLYEEVVDSGAPPRAASKVLREAHDRGLPGFYDELVASYPGALDDDELARCAASAAAPSAGLLASELARRGKTSRALEVALRGASADGGLGISLYEVHGLILSFVGRGDLDEARALLDALERHHRVRGDELRAPSIVGVPGTPLARELVAVAGRLPEELREPIADMLVHASAGGGDAMFVTTWAAAHSWKARRVRRLLKREAPFLHAIVAPLMKAPPAPRDPFPKKSGDGLRFSWLAVVAVLHLFRAACNHSSCDQAYDHPRGIERFEITAPAAPPPPAPATPEAASEPLFSSPEGYEGAGANDPAASE
jgi:hypothetical protein